MTIMCHVPTQVQTDWELLATFYCPDKPDNVPNALHGVAAYDSLNGMLNFVNGYMYVFGLNLDEYLVIVGKYG